MKNFNWKKFGWQCLYVLIVIVLNTPTWVYIIGKMVPYANFNNGEFKLSWIDYLELSKQVSWYAKWLLYLGIALGLFLSLSFIKYLWKERKREQQEQRQNDRNNKNTQAIIDAINKKNEKDINKYL